MSNVFEPQSAEDIENKIEKYRRSYAPEWTFDRENPDAGSVIAQLFARQIEENNRLMSLMPERYHLEFVNMLDATLRPARPAGSLVVFNMDTETLLGSRVPKGTKLTADSGKTASGYVIYETDRNLFVTESRIKSVFMTDADRGTISPVFGDISVPEILTGIPKVMSLEEEMSEMGMQEPLIQEETEESSRIRHFVLFGEKNTVGKSILTIYEERLFEGVGEPIYIRLEDAEEVIKRITEGKIRFKYYTNHGFEEFDKINLLKDGKTFALIKNKQCRRVTIDEKEYSVVILESTRVMTDSLEIGDITVSAGGSLRFPEFVGDGSLELDTDKFSPFSDTLAVYNECFIGHSPCFSKAGAKITLDFKVNYKDNFIRISAEEEEAELLIIKRKNRKTPFDIPIGVKVNEIVFEYFNGIGWKKLRCDSEYAAMFESCEAGQFKLSFICPEDWQESESGPYVGKCLRMRLVRADNCYMRPATHTYPIIEKLKISYSYEGKFRHPARLERIAGTRKEDITQYMFGKKPFTILSGIDYHQDALFIGLDKKLNDGPISIYFQLSETASQEDVKFSVEYSGANGFNQMRITDLTENFTRSGTIMFMPPQDMAKMTIEGNRLYWLKLVRNKSRNADYRDVFLPNIARMCLNAVTVTNVQTLDEKDYYIDEAVPGNSVALGVNNILDANIWVNEKGFTRKEEMDELLQFHPERVRVEYDFLGRVSALFVLWDEVDSFEDAPHKRCYRIDRMTGKVLFSDGNKCDMPRVIDDIAFKASVRSTDGELGNVQEGKITGFTDTAPYIDSVYNPIRSHGGSNLETLDHAMDRCAGIMHSRERLVSETDYIRYVLEYSGSIDKCSVVVGRTRDGRDDPENISIVLLMKDYADGAFSFHRISAALQRDIYKRCPITVKQDSLNIVEPIFVTVSVSVWALVMEMDDAFEVQSEVKSILTEYLNPVSTEGSEGWGIGTLPKDTQILMRLSALRSSAIIQRITMIGTYVDATGEHELDTKDIDITPFMVVRSGEHRVIITNK